MKVKIRRTTNDDLDNIFILHTKCFSQNDCWYKSAIKNHLDTGIVVEHSDTKELIGVLLHGKIIPCNQEDTKELTSQFTTDSEMKGYMKDVFEPVNKEGVTFYNNKLHLKEIDGIVMICVNPKYRGKGLAKKLIEKHFKDNQGKVVCLNTRRSNINAYQLYKIMGYNHIALIKNKYFLPTEDSVFMIKEICPI
jgi:ribosomal protein S18 acetylase RimI-like enzyme